MKLRGPIVLYQPRDEGRLMPLGLLHLGSALRHPVVIVDGRLDLAPEARVAGLAREALWLGVGVPTGKPIADALRITRAVRSANPELPIIWCGPHPTRFAEQCLASGVVDACVLGPGAETVVELTAALRDEHDGSGIAGLAWRRGEAVVMGRPRLPVEAARSARADYALLDVESYFRSRESRRLDYSSSGTPWPAPEALVPPWSGLPSERVVAEVRDLVGRLRLAEIAFQDDDFFAEPRRAEAIARGLLGAGVHVAWSAAGRASLLARLGGESGRALTASGCRRIHIRTPGDTVLRGDEEEALLEAARRIKAAGIGGRFTFTAGFPGRGADSIADIHRVALKLRRMDARFETPIRLHAPLPGAPGATPPGFRVPERLEEWVEADLGGGGPWLSEVLRRRAARYHFFLEEAFRPPGRRFGKRLLRRLARARVRLGFYRLDLDRRVVEWAARIRTGRRRGQSTELDE